MGFLFVNALCQWEVGATLLLLVQQYLECVGVNSGRGMPQQDDITSLSISNIGGAIASGEMTTLEVTEAHLERIARLQPQINCFIASEPETAR